MEIGVALGQMAVAPGEVKRNEAAATELAARAAGKDVDLFVLEASALYYFADSAIQEFQPYLGGGFSFGIPHAKFKEVRIDYDTGEVFEEIDRDEWSFEPGVHGFIGASYYINNLWAVNVEGRGQIMQSRFPINVPDIANDTIEEVDVIVDYSGFLIGIGIARAF